MRGEGSATAAIEQSARPAVRGGGRGGSERPSGISLSAECDRLQRGNESLSSEAMVVEDAASAKTEEQDRLKALDASIANLEKARGGKPDVAIDQVLRQKRLERQKLKDQMQSRKSTRAAIAARAAVAETTGDFRRKGAKQPTRRERSKRWRRGVWPRSIATGRFLMSPSSASCSAPLSPQQWALGLAASLPEGV